ncbi:hypothetical protein ACTVNX_03585 [Serratia nevei]|uniref:hypothetical protein n=1 Tax=Serratia TaxID=613 RepID=UPI0039B6CF5E
MLLRRLTLFQQVTHYFLSLRGERNDVWGNTRWLYALLTHLELKLLDDFRWDDPEPLIQMELVRGCKSKLTYPSPRQQQQTKPKLGLQHPAVLAELLHEFRQFPHPEEGVVLDRGLRGRHDIQIRGVTLLKVGGL